MTVGATRVLVVEDDAQMRRFLRTMLIGHGYQVREALTAAEGVAAATECAPDVLLLDLGLPDRDGLEVARRVREWSQVPILVISARGREEDKVLALDLGADDYLTKPFGTQELLARMRVALRRVSREGSGADPRVRVGDVIVDPARRLVTRRGLEVHLTPIEYRLLLELAKNAGRVLTHRHILREVWGKAHMAQNEYLRVYMLQLRRKLEDDPARPRLILTEPGVGYRMREAEPIETA